MTDKLLDAANKFKIGQTVFMYVDPSHSNSPETSPVWECEVEQIKATRMLNLSGRESQQKDEINIELEVSFGFSSITYPASKFYSDFDAAKKAGLENLAEIKLRRKENRNKNDAELDEAISALESQQAE